MNIQIETNYRGMIDGAREKRIKRLAKKYNGILQAVSGGSVGKRGYETGLIFEFKNYNEAVVFANVGGKKDLFYIYT